MTLRHLLRHRGAPSLPHAVPDVLQLSPRRQVGRVHARRVIASVKDAQPFGYRSNEHLVGDAVGYVGTRLDAKGSVPSRVAERRPQPAPALARYLVDLREETMHRLGVSNDLVEGSRLTGVALAAGAAPSGFVSDRSVALNTPTLRTTTKLGQLPVMAGVAARRRIVDQSVAVEAAVAADYTGHDGLLNRLSVPGAFVAPPGVSLPKLYPGSGVSS